MTLAKILDKLETKRLEFVFSHRPASRAKTFTLCGTRVKLEWWGDEMKWQVYTLGWHFVDDKDAVAAHIYRFQY